MPASWRKGTGAPTVVGAYRLLRAAMTTAVDDELVRRNPCRIPRVVALRRQGLVEQAPKSRAGRRSVARRTLALPPPIMPDLTAHLRDFAQPGRDGLVFVGPRGGRLWRSNFQPHWDRALAGAGVRDDLHFHDLRHTGNTLAASSGASLRELMAHMGHSTSRAALIYQHATKRGERAIGDFLGGLIERRHDGQAATEGATDADGARGGHAGP